MNKQLYYSNTINSEYFHNTVSLFLNEVYDIMKECYGPYGSHILIDGQIRPEATKDGKTILSKIVTNKSIPTAVHGSIMSVANKQVDEVGDGSTTTILLLCKLYERFRMLISDYNISPSVFNSSIKMVVSKILKKLKDEYAEKIVSDSGEIDFDKLYEAIHTSVDGDVELATKILDMFKELNSTEPMILIEMSPNEHHRYELVKGVETEGTIIKPEIFFNGLSRKEYINPTIILINGRFDMSFEHYLNLAESSLRDNRDYIILATGVNEDTLAGITSVATSNPALFSRTPIFQIRNSALDEEFKDLVASLGAKSIDSETFKRVTSFDAVKNIIEKSAGSCEKALLTEFCARFNSPNSNEEEIKMIISDIEQKIEDLKNDPTSHNARLNELEDRKAFLSRSYAKFYVGGYSPQRKAINYELANDGIPQAISCMKHGIVQGCNTVVPEIIDDILSNEEYDDMGNKEMMTNIYKTILDSYIDLMTQLVSNKVGYEKAKNYIENVRPKNSSFNIRPNDNVNVINSADTDRAILQNSTDMAALLATSRAFISRNPEFDVVNKGYDHLD